MRDQVAPVWEPATNSRPATACRTRAPTGVPAPDRTGRSTRADPAIPCKPARQQAFGEPSLGVSDRHGVFGRRDVVAESSVSGGESAAAREHASYSILAMTTWTCRSLRTAAARRRSPGARSRGQSSSASSRGSAGSGCVRPDRPGLRQARHGVRSRPVRECRRASPGSAWAHRERIRGSPPRRSSGSGSGRPVPPPPPDAA